MKKKKAAESYGGMGMAKYIDSNEARRIARLKKVKSSIRRSSMTQHSGWQKAQIEQRRKEQLRQRKQQANKKPIGDGIKVETSIPIDYTTTGLKLKHQIDNLADNQSAKQYKEQVTFSNQAPLPINPVRRRNESTSTKVQREKETHKMRSAKMRLEVKDRLQALSLSSNDNRNKNVSSGTTHITSKRPSRIPKFNGRAPSNKTSKSEENKENDLSSLDPKPKYTSRATNLKKPTTQKHFQLATDLNALKREHADALKMLQELDKEENRRRSLGSADSDYSFDSDESSGRDIFERANRGGRCENEANGEQFVTSSETVSRSIRDAGLDESFAWLPEGIKDASHLSIILNEDIESQQEIEYEDMEGDGSCIDADHFESEPAYDDTVGEEDIKIDITGTKEASIECFEDHADEQSMSELKQDDVSEHTGEYDDDTRENASIVDSYENDGESSSSQTDDYLSDTSGY